MARQALNVLVIDDDPAMLALLQEIVLRMEHQVLAVTSAEEGLELLPYWTFQVAFIDQQLPGMEGLVLGEFLRRNNPDMTIALVTGDPDRGVRRKTKDLQIVHIQKPFQMAEILRVLDDCVEAAKLRQQLRLNHEDHAFEPQFAEYAEEIASSYDMPKVPSRLSERLTTTLKRSLNNLRSVSRYTERDRAVALAGLLCAKVLGVDLPKREDGTTLYEEYDALMQQHGRRVEFGAPAADD